MHEQRGQNIEPTDAEIDKMQAGANEVCDHLESCFAKLDLDAYQRSDLMGGLLFFAIKSISWCHRHMGPEPDALELVIAQLADGLRATVRAAEGNHHDRGE